jgi:hypothetical protein
MASTATTRNRLEKQGAGENSGTWGTRLNTNTFDMVDEAMDGYESIAVAADVTLTSVNFSTDQARKRVLRFTGAGGFNVIIPGVTKVYYIDNRCSAAVGVKTSGGTAASVAAGIRTWVYCDATDCFALTTTTSGWNLLSSTAASSTATLAVTGNFSSTYDFYRLDFLNVKPVTDDVNFAFQIGTGVGPTYQGGASDYAWGLTLIGPSGSADRSSVTNLNGTRIYLSDVEGTTGGVGNSPATGEHIDGSIYFANPDVAQLTPMRFECTYNRALDAFPMSVTGSGIYTTGTAITGIRFFFSSGNISSGTFNLSGFAK